MPNKKNEKLATGKSLYSYDCTFNACASSWTEQPQSVYFTHNSRLQKYAWQYQTLASDNTLVLVRAPAASVRSSSRKPDLNKISTVGWLAGWLVGWLAGWLVGWLAGWLVGGLADWLAR
jgi:hypothetical protein